ncbi:unnamed protein product, partial [Rotaria sp. Silwood2]
QYGIGLSWNFPFSIEYWKSVKIEFNRKMSDDSLDSQSDDFQYNDNSLIVQVESIRKYFTQTKRTVINNISFNLYRNQITAIIGHNGAEY